jgi:uncharacterized protein (TIGR03437 family)
MPHWVMRVFVLALFPLVVGAQERRDVIVVVSDPSVIEQVIQEEPEPRARRSRVLSDDGERRAVVLRSRKARLAAAIRGSGADIVGSTEFVLNALLVRATPEQLEALRGLPGVESVLAAPEMRLFLDAAVPLVRAPEAWALPAIGGEANAGRGIKIAIIDTGIDQTHPMFRDSGLQVPAGYPKGDTQAMISGSTNSKVIVARDFTGGKSAADVDGHGTFVAGIAAGDRVQSVSPSASISGVAPKAYLGNYRVISNESASSHAVMDAIDAAVRDGMDVINLSVGSSEPIPPEQDPYARLVQNANAVGVVVVAASGNSGPAARTVSSPASLPAVLAVGATSNARLFSGTVIVASADGLPASLARISGFPGSQPVFKAVFGPAPLADVSALDPSALACLPSASLPSGVVLAPRSLSSQVALIKRGLCTFTEKIQNATAAGAVGALIYNNVDDTPPLMDTRDAQIPSMIISKAEGEALARFLAGRRAQASFDPTLSAWPATSDVLARFSSRGPAGGSTQPVKPDVVAPGRFILSAAQNQNPNGDIYSLSGYAAGDGTSMSTPMVAGAAALVKQAHPGYTPDQTKSALVNTAVPISTSEDGAPISAQNSGAGRLNVLAALTTSLLAQPTALSFATHAPRSTFRASQPLKITNVGAAADTLTLRIVPRQPHPSVIVELDNSALSLAPTQSAQVLVTLYNTGFTQTVAEGSINIASQAPGKSINVPYWVSYVVPEVNPNGVVNAASYRSESGVAPGSIVSIFGVALSSVSAAGANILPLPTLLGGTSAVFSTDSGTGQTTKIAVPLFYSSSGQVNAQIPFEARAGTTATMTLSVDGLAGASLTLRVTPYNPGLFSRTQDGSGLGAILHGNATPVTSDWPARPGESVSLYATGLGAVDNRPDTGKPASSVILSNTLTRPAVSIGGRDAVVTFSGLAPGFVGLYQVNVIVPADLVNGEHPVVLNIGGLSSNTVLLRVQQ